MFPQQNPYHRFNFAAVTPISADPYFYYRNSVPYTENYMFSIQRQITQNALLTVSYAGNQGHHLLVLVPANLGNPALVPEPEPAERSSSGKLHLRAFRRRRRLHVRIGQGYQGTRVGLGSNFGSMTAQKTIGNSNYNALEATFRLTPRQASHAAGCYTYSKSIDEASNLGEQINPFNERLTRVISSWDMTHNFVATYTYALPFDRFFGRNRLTEGWSSRAQRASARDSR